MKFIMSILVGFALSNYALADSAYNGTIRIYDNSMNGISQNGVEIYGDAAKFLYDSFQGLPIKDAELETWHKTTSKVQCFYHPSASEPYYCLLNIGNCDAADNTHSWPVPKAASCGKK